MADGLERASLARRVVLMVMASAFLVWQVPHMDMFERLAGDSHGVARSLSTFGFLVWIAALVALLYSGRLLARRLSSEARAALEDELVAWNRGRAFTIGYAVALIAAAVMFAISLYQPVSGADAAHVVLVAAVVAPMYAFAVLERINA